MLLLLQLIPDFLKIIFLQLFGPYLECCLIFQAEFSKSPRNDHVYPTNIRMKKLRMGANLTWNPVLLPANVREHKA